jgi:hypothetical protein
MLSMSLRRVALNSLSIITIDDSVYTLCKNNENLNLLHFNLSSWTFQEVANFKGSKGFLLRVWREEKYLLSIDDKLVFLKGGDKKIVLKASKPGNFFNHAIEAYGKVFVQEYGSTPTGIYVSNDMKRWQRLITNNEVDKHSGHFHFITYDPYREWLIATLGDSCLTRVVVSENFGKSWRPLYKGPWQFVPVEVLEDEIVFGMDSSLAKGGVGIYNPNNEHWKFLFIKWKGMSANLMQMSTLKMLDNHIWAAALGTPQAIIISVNLSEWHPLYVEGLDKEYSHYVSLSEGNDIVACCFGKSLLVAEKNKLKEIISSANPVASEYNAFYDMLKGFGAKMKRKIGIYS